MTKKSSSQRSVSKNKKTPHSHPIKAARAASSEKREKTSSKAGAIANNDVAITAWNYNENIENCLGFAVYHIDSQSKKTALPAWVGFKTETNDEWQPKTTEQWPVQKFNWRDLTAARGGSYQYQIVPMVGTPDNLKPLQDLALISNTIYLKPDCGDNVLAYFNRGILSTQSLVHQLPKGGRATPDYQKLEGRIDQPGDPLRKNLAGDMLKALPLMLERARKEGGECFCALYELTDTEMEQLLLTSNPPSSVHIILSNTEPSDDENRPARQALHEANIVYPS